MSPIDDELRAALHGRASVLAPSPDPLTGIEARARRMQRNRVGGAVAGSALAVALVAAVVPAVQSATSAQPDVPRFATAAPVESHSTDTSPYALNPDAPWDYRGEDPSALGQGSLETIEREYATKRGATSVELSPLFGRVYEPSQQFELVFLAEVDGSYRWGVAQTPTEAGPEFPVDEALPEPALALAAALDGDEAARMIVVAAPRTTLDYGPDGASEFTSMTPLADGVATIALEGDPKTDLYRVTADGEEVHRAPAPDAGAVETGEPAAALDPDAPWEVRGDPSLVTAAQLEALGEDWAQRHGVDASQVEARPLFVQRYEPSAGVEVTYLVRFKDNPWMWGVSSLGEDGWSWYAENELAPGTTALVAALPGDDGTERLLVVAAPSTSGAVYAGDGRDYRPMTDVDAGVFMITTLPGDTDDRFKVLDGDGDMDDPVFEGPAPEYQNAG